MPRRRAPASRAPEPEPPNPAASVGAPQDLVTIRHYCQGIGDCHLLRFPKPGGGTYNILIDCGVHSAVKGGSITVDRIVADIAKTVDRIDVLVVTHEHWDHVSGFLTAAAAFASIPVGEVWVGWTENPADPQARQLDTFKGQSIRALQEAHLELNRAVALSPEAAVTRDQLGALLGFSFGAAGERVRSARDAAIGLAPNHVRYLEPTQAPWRLDGIAGVRVYVLGPPRGGGLLKLTERASEMYGLGAAGPWCPAGAADAGAPFDPTLGTPLASALGRQVGEGPPGAQEAIVHFMKAHYTDPVAAAPGRKKATGKRRAGVASASGAVDQSWRRIDAEWLGASADLAMQLDKAVNNTSLVLAFEFVDTGRVMLFAADAQVGSWLSWQDLTWQVESKAVTGPELLGRTVYLKVGHHGSHNATLKSKGLEQMRDPDLSGFIPTNAADAQNIGWGKMPFAAIVKELTERTRGRLIRADDAWIAGEALDGRFAAPSGSLRRVGHEPGLWVEVDIA